MTTTHKLILSMSFAVCCVIGSKVANGWNAMLGSDAFFSFAYLIEVCFVSQFLYLFIFFCIQHRSHLISFNFMLIKFTRYVCSPTVLFIFGILACRGFSCFNFNNNNCQCMRISMWNCLCWFYYFGIRMAWFFLYIFHIYYINLWNELHVCKVNVQSFWS